MAADAQHVLAEGASGHLGDDEVSAGSDRREVGRQGPSRQPGPGNQGRKSEQAWSVTRTESLPRPVDSESQAGPGRETQGHGGQEGDTSWGASWAEEDQGEPRALSPEDGTHRHATRSSLSPRFKPPTTKAAE